MEVAGLCHSDYHFMKGHAVLPLPLVAGHEGSGTVVDVGEGVERVKPGDRCILSFVSTAATAGYAVRDGPTYARRTSRPGCGNTTGR